MKKCKKCGRENPDDLFYCARCGSPLPEVEADVKRRTSSKRVARFMEIVLAAVSIFILLTMFFYSGGTAGLYVVIGVVVVLLLLALVAGAWYLSHD
ncbi:MAG: hypothetical protein QW567_01990 [Candidatus Hadarchaeales archaeon]